MYGYWGFTLTRGLPSDLQGETHTRARGVTTEPDPWDPCQGDNRAGRLNTWRAPQRGANEGTHVGMGTQGDQVF